MASALQRGKAAAYTEQVLEAGTEVVSTAEPDKGEKATKLISFRLNEYDHRRIKALFAKAGLSMGTGCALAARYLADLMERGKIDVSRSGIIPKD
jgi:selenocysteine lyase/cysteine desulfurase